MTESPKAPVEPKEAGVLVKEETEKPLVGVTDENGSHEGSVGEYFQQGPALDAEDNDYSDTDSALGSTSGSSTTSISSSIMKYREENGRTYHAYKEGKYVLPNDAPEQDRLDLQHHLCVLTQGGQLHLNPIFHEKAVHRVLDVGCGTGIWSIDFADEHPEVEVTGIDLSPIQPPFVPPNCQFEVDDLEEEWNFHRPFDFIYSRMMTGSIADWPAFFKQCYDNLTPGGYIEQFEITFPTQVDDDSWPKPRSALRDWGDLIVEAAAKIGRPANAALHHVQQLKDAGFVDVVQVPFRWPTNRWPRDARMKELGMWNNENLTRDVAALSLGVFTHGLGWSKEQIEVFLIDVRREMNDTRVHAYYPIYVVYARKPL